MPQLPCLTCKHAEISSTELSPHNKFIRCPYKNEGRWRFYKITREYPDFECNHYEAKT
ncbi:MAG: hypothetical protein NDF54_05040 [archaeon GB-1867-035]|nr:hypothetical protein [Candidatus Culexmicrobium profundum]